MTRDPRVDQSRKCVQREYKEAITKYKNGELVNAKNKNKPINTAKQGRAVAYYYAFLNCGERATEWVRRRDPKKKTRKTAKRKKKQKQQKKKTKKTTT